MGDEPVMCPLQEAVGRAEVCPGESCPFWEPGGAVLRGRCAFDELDLTGRASVAGVLLQVRQALEARAGRERRVATRRLFYHLLNEGGE